MPFDPVTGLFTRTANSFSDPVFGTEIDPTDATSLFNDYDSGLSEQIHIVTSGTPTIASTDVFVLINKTAGSATSVVLPTSVTKTKPVLVADIKGDAQANNITVSFTGGQTCQGQATIVIRNNYGSMWFYPLAAGGWYLDESSSSMPAWTIRGNVTNGVALATNFTIDGLTDKASPAAADELILWDVAGAAIKKCAVSSIASAGSVSSIAGNTGAFTLVQPITNVTNALVLNATITPQGRLTLTTATPVLTTSQNSKTEIFYTPYVGNLCPIYDGTNVIPTVFAEISNLTVNSAVGNAGPAAVGANANYDLFVWSNSGTPTLTRGPLWTSDTGRGTGAGTTELVRVKGLLLNANSITNGPAAQRGTYVGTFRSGGTTTVTIDYIFGANAAGGTAGWFGVWNAYNRINVATTVGNTTDSWAYAVATTWRAPNASATMRASFVRGLDDDPIDVAYYAFSLPGALTSTSSGIGLDSTTVPSGLMLPNFVAAQLGPTSAQYNGIPGLGFHFVSALEYNSTSTSSTFYGDAAVAYCQTGLVLKMRI